MVVFTVLCRRLSVVKIMLHVPIVSQPFCMTIFGFTSHACSTARDAQSAHVRATGRNVRNSLNSVGDTVAGGRGHCVFGGTTPLSTSVRCWCVRLAEEKLASFQQETWAGRVESLGLAISQEVEIQPGCAVKVSRLPVPFFALESPGQGREVGRWIVWTPLEQTTRSGVWLFRGALGGECIFCTLCSWGLGQERIVPRSVRSLHFLCVLSHMRMGKARLSGH